MVTLNFQHSGYIFQGLYEKIREKLVKADGGQIRENPECQFRECGLHSESNVESLKASEKGRIHGGLPLGRLNLPPTAHTGVRRDERARRNS